jgi:hypothetical protein
MMKQKTFPLDFLAVEVKGVMEHFSKMTKSPLNYIVASAFTAVGAAAGKRLEVIDGAYRNYGQLYTCLVGVPGASKSPAMDVAMKPLKDVDEAAYSSYKTELRVFKKKQKMSNDFNEEQPKLRKLVTSDTTFEKLASMMSENNGSMLIHADELTGFLLNLDRYNNGTNMPKLLEMWTNNNITIDRKGDESLLIPRPFLSILGSTQPTNLSRLFEKYKGNGFFPRWTFVLSDGKPESRIQPDPICSAYWEKVIRCVLEMDKMELHFDSEVLPLLQSFDDEREMRTDFFAENNPEMAETYAKSSYKVRRIAGIVHLLSEENCIANKIPSNTISLGEFNYAVRIVEFFEECSMDVLNMMVEKKVDRLTDKRLLYELNKRFNPTFSITEFAKGIGRSKQYVSRCFLGGDTAEIENKEKTIKNISGNIKEIVGTLPNLYKTLGSPSDEEIEVMYDVCGGNVNEIVNRLKKIDSQEISGGMSYPLLIELIGNSS